MGGGIPIRRSSVEIISSLLLYLVLCAFVIGMLPVQFTCLTVFFHNLSPSFLWSTSWTDTLHFILHTLLHPIIVFFSQHMPIPSQPVLLQYREIMLCNPSPNPQIGSEFVNVFLVHLTQVVVEKG